MPRPLNNAEGGSNTTTVTTGNSGGSSGNAFDAVSIGVGSGLVFDNAQAAHGSLSYKYTFAGNAVYTSWTTTTLGAARRLWFYRLCVYVPVFSVTFTPLMAFYGSGSLRATFGITNVAGSGQPSWNNSVGGSMVSGAANVPAATWVRFEGLVGGDATAGQAEILYYSTKDSISATSSRSAATYNTGGLIDEVRWGDTTGLGLTYNLDDLGVCDLGYLGAPILSYNDNTPPLSATVWGDVATVHTKTYTNNTPPLSATVWGDVATVAAKTYKAPDLFNAPVPQQIRMPHGGNS